MKQHLLNNLAWFQKSGVMLPADGLWGVAERVAVTDGNAAIDEMKNAFQAWTDHDGYCIIEQRRADCNFEAAYLFLLASQALDAPAYRAIGENILDFLYFRSGLLNRSKTSIPRASWNWSHVCWSPVVYFDDDAWCVALPLKIARLFPELDAKYNLTQWAVALAGTLLEAAERTLPPPPYDAPAPWKDPLNATDRPHAWQGNLALPHWGALVAMALALASKASPNPAAADFIAKYRDYLKARQGDFTVSEYAYIILGYGIAAQELGNPDDKALAIDYAKRLVSRMDESGNLPAEHYEAPQGARLVDTIYTANWALLGLHELVKLDASFAPSYEKLRALLLAIQDTSPEPQFNGCWRGMFDLDANAWGGGNRYEGGAGSIYTGWTNAPIAMTLALDIMEQTATLEHKE